MKTARNRKNWEVLSKASLLDRRPWLSVYQEAVSLPDGRVVQDYYGIEMPSYTAVFAITDERQIIVLRSYRHALGEVMLNMPGGMVEEGEDPLAAIQRELLEETGYSAAEWTSLGNFIGNSSRGCGNYYFFFASGASPIQEPDSGDLEELELLLWTPEELVRALDAGEARSLGTVSIFLMGLRCLESIQVTPMS